MGSNEKADAAKAQGNDAFKNKDYATAIKLFSEAIQFAPEMIELYSNRSAAYAKNNQLAEAVADGDKCVSMNPEWSKGYARQGAALTLSKDFAKAVACYEAGLVVDPGNDILTKGLASAMAGMTSKKKKKKRGKKGKDAGEEKDEEKREHIDYVIGIDLGTTYSCVGVWINDGVTIIENNDGQKTIPSYVSFDPKSGDRKTGHAAKNQMTQNSKGTIYDVKRIIGQRWDDTGVEADIKKMQYDCIKVDDKPMIKVDIKGEERLMAPEEISAMVLTTCKEIAEKYLKQKVTRAVVTVPAYFNDAQRNATKVAGRIAGLDVLRIINEPTAAALSYGMDNKSKKSGATNVLIFDLGGGTFDVSILTIEGGLFTVKATGGDTRLGGEDFDNNVITLLISEAEKQGFKDVREDSRAMQRLRKAAELAKRELSNSQFVDVALDAFMGGKSNFRWKLTRASLEAVNKAPFLLCMDTVQRVLKDAKLKPKDIDEIVLVGGSTRIPKLQEMLVEVFGGKPLCKSLNPDEAVAYGAAVQGAILCGKRNSKTDSLLLMDVTPLSLGIEITGRVMSVIIPRNTPIPCVKTQTYTTDRDYQTEDTVSVYEGERMSTRENNLLGEFNITGIESAKRGEPQINVSFSIDSNGILEVTAKDQKTGANANIQISNRSQATTQEIDNMVAEAAKFKAQDEERIRKTESFNELENCIYDCFSTAKEMDDQKLASILVTAAEKEQEWLDVSYETAKASEVAMRRRQLSRRLESKGRLEK